MVPREDFSKIIRKIKEKPGIIPHQQINYTNNIELRDSFNGIISQSNSKSPDNHPFELVVKEVSSPVENINKNNPFLFDTSNSLIFEEGNFGLIQNVESRLPLHEIQNSNLNESKNVQRHIPFEVTNSKKKISLYEKNKFKIEDSQVIKSIRF